jgi:hypothetical protein
VQRRLWLSWNAIEAFLAVQGNLLFSSLLALLYFLAGFLTFFCNRNNREQGTGNKERTEEKKSEV